MADKTSSQGTELRPSPKMYRLLHIITENLQTPHDVVSQLDSHGSTFMCLPHAFEGVS